MFTPRNITFDTWAIEDDRDFDGVHTVKVRFLVEVDADAFIEAGSNDGFRSQYGFRVDLVSNEGDVIFTFEQLLFRIQCDRPRDFGGGFGEQRFCRFVPSPTPIFRFASAPVLIGSDIAPPTTYRYASPLLERDVLGEVLDVNPAIPIPFMGGQVPFPREDRVAARVTLVELSTGRDGLSETSAFERGLFGVYA